MKAAVSTQFIGTGVKDSSTYAYEIASGELANTGKYTGCDVVWVSVNGNRPNRVPAVINNQLNDVYECLRYAMMVGATIVQDHRGDRLRRYNVGEREIADYLYNLGYQETDDSGIWTPSIITL